MIRNLHHSGVDVRMDHTVSYLPKRLVSTINEALLALSNLLISLEIK